MGPNPPKFFQRLNSLLTKLPPPAAADNPRLSGMTCEPAWLALAFLIGCWQTFSTTTSKKKDSPTRVLLMSHHELPGGPPWTVS